MTRAPLGQSVKIHGPALRFVREAAGRSIGQLARAADISTGFLARVERGVKTGVGAHVFAVLVAELELDDPRVILINPYAQSTASGWTSGSSSGTVSGMPERVQDRAA